MKRPEQHVIGEQAETRLRAVLPATWVIRNINPDYGVDLEVELVDQEMLTGNRVWIQLKGTRSLTLSTHRPNREAVSAAEDAAGSAVEERFVSYTLDKKEIDYALRCPFPLLLVVVDVLTGYVYWHPIRDDIVTRFGRVTSLRGQASVTMRISVRNRLDDPEDSSRFSGLRWYAVEPARMYAFARLHHLIHEFHYRGRLTGYSIGDGWIDDNGATELADSLRLADAYLEEALSLEVLFSSAGDTPIATFAHIRELMENARRAATEALETLDAGTFTFQQLSILLASVVHGINMMSTTIASYAMYRTRYLCDASRATFRSRR